LRKAPPLTIVYLTFRAEPRFEWFAASLERELKRSPETVAQIIVIDGRYPRKLKANFQFEHHAPKPTVWQGLHRLTKRDYFCAANSRNTALALARHEHVVFVDDLSVLVPGWLKAHLHAAKHGYVLCGLMCKRANMEVSKTGEILRADEIASGTDPRLAQLPDEDVSRCEGGALYGGTFSVPLELALQVNGQDEIYDAVGAEDCDFGTRLERAGGMILINRTCRTFEGMEGHAQSLPRIDNSEEICRGLFDRLRREEWRTRPLGNAFDLRAMRESVLAGESFPVPDGPATCWVDGISLSEL